MKEKTISKDITCKWMTFAERIEVLGAKLKTSQKKSLSSRCFQEYAATGNEPTKMWGNGRMVVVYPPWFFKRIDEMVSKEIDINAVSDRDWNLFEENDCGRAESDHTMQRNALVSVMADQYGLSDFQIAHTYLRDQSGKSFVIPMLEDVPKGLVRLASEYVSHYRGNDVGPLIRRLRVRDSKDRNVPFDPPEIARIRERYAAAVRRAEQQAAPEDSFDSLRQEISSLYRRVEALEKALG